MAADDPGALRLRLVARMTSGERSDLELEARADTRVEDALAAVAESLGQPRDGLRAFSSRTGRTLGAEEALRDAGLRHGDELLLTRDGAPPGSRRQAGDELELTVVGGPGAGRRVPIGSGGVSVGRERGDVVVDDPALSGEHVRVEPGGRVLVEDLRSRNGTSVEGVPLTPGEPRELEPGDVVQTGRTLLAVAPVMPERGGPAADGTPSSRCPRRPRRRCARASLRRLARPARARLGLYLLTKLPTMLFFAALSPVMAVSTYIEDRRSGRRSFVRRSREFRQRLAPTPGSDADLPV